MFASCMDLVSEVPEGQSALATPGTCCSPFHKRPDAMFAATEILSLTSGAPKKAKPAVRAVKRSSKAELVF